MSLAETQEIMQVLQEIMALLNNVEFKTTKLERDTPMISRNLQNFRQLERIALRFLAITRQMGLPDDIEKATQALTRLIVIIRMAQMSLTALASTNPYTAVIGVLGLAATFMAAPSVLEGY